MAKKKDFFKKWFSLNQFHSVAKSLGYEKHSRYLSERGNIMPYKTKIKLHGTNALVTITPEKDVIAGKRSQFMPTGGQGGDNAGFAAWVESRRSYFEQLYLYTGYMTIYGEWAGPGIQNGVSVSETDRKHFYVFAILYDCGEFQELIYDPKIIEDELTGLNGGVGIPDDVIILPYHTDYVLDFADGDKLKASMEAINLETEAIGVCDPFIKEIFEIEGAGEGLVFYPDIANGIYRFDPAEGMNEIEVFNVFNFKAKSEAHRVNATKKAVVANPEVLSTKQRFADMFCTEARFEQAFMEAVDRQADPKLTGTFIQWVQNDIFKESADERALIEMDWKGLCSVIGKRSAEWYKRKVGSVHLGPKSHF